MSHYRVRFVRVSLYIGSVGHLTAGAPTCIVVVMYSVQYVWGATVILNLQSFSPTYCNRRGGGETEILSWYWLCHEIFYSQFVRILTHLGPLLIWWSVFVHMVLIYHRNSQIQKNSAVSSRPQIWTPRCQWYQNPWHQGQRRVKTIYVKFQWFFVLLWRGSFTKSWLCFFMIKIQLKRLKLLIIFLGDFLYLKNKSCWLRGVIDTELFFLSWPLVAFKGIIRFLFKVFGGSYL